MNAHRYHNLSSMRRAIAQRAYEKSLLQDYVVADDEEDDDDEAIADNSEEGKEEDGIEDSANGNDRRVVSTRKKNGITKKIKATI